MHEQSYGDLSLVTERQLLASHGEAVVLPEAEMQLMASLVRAQGRVVRRTVLEMRAWGVWQTVTPDALGRAIQQVRAKLVALGSSVRIGGTPETGFALSRTD
jgi:DNA-binding response OmpR family regulator